VAAPVQIAVTFQTKTHHPHRQPLNFCAILSRLPYICCFNFGLPRMQKQPTGQPQLSVISRPGNRSNLKDGSALGRCIAGFPAEADPLRQQPVLATGDYQNHIVARYRAAGVRLMDVNSGFEPATFDDEVYARWRPTNRGPWRFIYDEQKERADVERVMRMLKAVPPRRKRVYILVGNEPFAACMQRMEEITGWGGEPHVQPYMKLNALEKRPNVWLDWSEQKLRDVARWANHWPWHKLPFAVYRRSEDEPRRSVRPATRAVPVNGWPGRCE
jgi:hypothetical protein